MGFKIIMAVCFLPCLLLMYGFLYFEGKQKGNILLGVTLWPEADQEGQVTAIQKQFKKEMSLLLVLSLLLFAGTCLFNRDSLVLSTQMLWLIFVIVIFFIPIAKGNQRLKTLKRERAAAVMHSGTRVFVDMKEADAPKEKPFIKLSLAGALCGLIPVIGELILRKDPFYGWWTELFLIIMFLIGVLCICIQYWFWNLKTDVISCRSEVNIQLARVRQYQWSRFWSLMIWCNTVFTVMMWYGLRKPKAAIYMIMAGIILYLSVLGIAAFAAERNVRKVYGKYESEEGLPVEEDDHWIYGIFYYNKNDKRFMVNKRVGIGTTVNMAKTSAKVFTGVVLGGTLALLIWACGWILLEDFVPISLELEEQAVVSGQYREDYRVPVSDIEEAELVEELPAMSKRVGSAMEYIRKGSFIAEGYVSCKVSIRTKEPPFLKITTADGMVYYLNDEEPKETTQVYEELAELLTTGK